MLASASARYAASFAVPASSAPERRRSSPARPAWSSCWCVITISSRSSTATPCRASPCSSRASVSSICGPASTSVSGSPRSSQALTSPIWNGVGSAIRWTSLRRTAAGSWERGTVCSAPRESRTFGQLPPDPDPDRRPAPVTYQRPSVSATARKSPQRKQPQRVAAKRRPARSGVLRARVRDLCPRPAAELLDAPHPAAVVLRRHVAAEAHRDAVAMALDLAACASGPAAPRRRTTIGLVTSGRCASTTRELRRHRHREHREREVAAASVTCGLRRVQEPLRVRERVALQHHVAAGVVGAGQLAAERRRAAGRDRGRVRCAASRRAAGAAS